MGGIFLFLCKEGSRNALNNDRTHEQFLENYQTLFGKCLPHMDTVDDVLKELSNEELEKLKATLVASLIEQKVFGKFRLQNQYYRVAVDATGVMSVNEGHCEHCLHKTSKNGTVTYFHNVLEAKLITPNGFCISLATEWIENPEDYSKQDSEQKAFKRLAAKLKEFYPRLPVCIHADGLYPNDPFFKICELYDWSFIVTLKDKSLKSLWEEIDLELLMNPNNTKRHYHLQKKTFQNFRWLNNLEYKGHKLSWVECCEEINNFHTRFVHATNLQIDFESVISISHSGRLRFKIENEGFNIQKNSGYGLSHKYSRNSATAMKNYVSLMQIAHLFNQLYELSSFMQKLMVGKQTIKNLWKEFLASFALQPISKTQFQSLLNTRTQFRYG